MNEDHHQTTIALDELIDALLALDSKETALRFLKDLCTPQELKALAERWRVAKLIDKKDLSYREIHEKTGASLATIVRVARFLNTEPFQGYRTMIDRLCRS
jgi:TrpR-related protein YerC/YecD